MMGKSGRVPLKHKEVPEARESKPEATRRKPPADLSDRRAFTSGTVFTVYNVWFLNLSPRVFVISGTRCSV